MKHVCAFLSATLYFTLCFGNPHSGYKYFYQQPAGDTAVQQKKIKVIITITNLQDGSFMDSVYVSIGTNNGYTNKQGVIEFENILPSLSAYITKDGYYTQVKKIKPILHFRLLKKETGSIATANNGLYQRPSEYFSGSSTVVSGNELRKVNPVNFADALKFFDPAFIVTPDNNYGDGPNRKPNVKIRGSYNFPASATIATNSSNNSAANQAPPSAGDFIAENISSPNQPVIFLNGMQVSLQTALDLDMNRIERITILKDAAATTAYGVRGGTGILLIETKQPQKGNLRVNYAAQVQVNTADLSSYNLMVAPTKLQLEQDAGMYTNNPSLLQKRQQQVDKGINTDWLSIPLRTATGTKHTLSLDGGDDDIVYGLDFSYNNMQGVMIGEKRINTAFGGYVGTRFKNFTLNNYLTYLKSDAARSPYGNFQEYAYQNPYWNPYDSLTGQMTKVLEEYTYQNDTVTFYNPAYNGVISTTNESAYSRLSNITSFNWILGKGFRMDGQFGISKQSDQTDFFLPPGHTVFANYSPDQFFKRGWYSQTFSDFLSMEGRLQLHYEKNIGLHHFYASGGASGMETRSEASGIALSGFVSDKFSDLAYGNAYANSKPSSGKIVNRLVSGFGNFTYSYDNRYQLEVSANADASSQFGDNNRVAPHWAVGGSWNLHQERFFTPNEILNQFRLRGSVGTTGNLFYQSYLSRTAYDYYTDKQYVASGSGVGTRGIGLGAFLTSSGNENLQAPQIMKENAGFDAVLLQNRLMVRFDWYHQKSTKLVLPVVSPGYTGFLNFNYYDNLGGIENKGMEFGLSYAILRNTEKQMLWTISINGIHNEDRITSTSNYIEQLNQFNDSMAVDQTRPQQKYIVGKSLTGIWAVNSLGIDPANGHEVFSSTDGSTTTTWKANDKILAGEVSPDLQGSFGSSFSIKNISAGLYFNYQFGGEYYNLMLSDKVENADLTYNVNNEAGTSRWTSSNTNALYKPLTLNGRLSDPTYATSRFIEKDNFIRCSAISLGYSLPKSLAAKISAQRIQLGFIANNPFSWNTRKDEQGIYYPLNRLYSFTLSTTF